MEMKAKQEKPAATQPACHRTVPREQLAETEASACPTAFESSHHCFCCETDGKKSNKQEK